MVRCRIFLGLIVILAACTNLAAQSGYKGKEFWLAFPQNARAESEYPIEQTVYITGPEGTQGLVKETATGNEYPFTLNALGFWKCQIDSVNTIIAEGKHKESVHVVTTEDVSVMAVSHRKASSDSYTAIPIQRLGNEYVITGYDPIPNIGAFATQFDVIATENDTKVTVRYPAAVVFDTTPRVETLDRGEVLHLGGKVTSITADLTGTIVLADKPVAVLTGHSCAQIPSKTNYCNFLIEMLPPATALGTEHVVARLAERERYTIRVVAAHDNTEVRVDGKRRLVLNKSEYYQDERLNDDILLTTTKPAYVMQYGHSADDDVNKIADPFMMLIAPTDKFLKEIDLVVPTFAKTADEIEQEKVFASQNADAPIVSADGSHIYYPNKSMKITPPAGTQQDLAAAQTGWVHWMNIVTTTEGIATFKVDGQPIARDLFKQVGTSSFYVAHIKIEAGRHKLRSDVPFATYLYGYGRGGANYDSYGHLCGQELK